jgi:hypothetical protein
MTANALVVMVPLSLMILFALYTLDRYLDAKYSASYEALEKRIEEALLDTTKRKIE